MPTLMRTFAAALLAALIAGCATKQAVREGVQRDLGEAAQTLEAARTTTHEAFWEVIDGVWLGGDAMPLEKPLVEDPVLRTPVQLKRQYPITLTQVAEFISTDVGVPVQVTQDAIDAAGAPGKADTLAPVTDTMMLTPGSFTLQYSGTLHGLLDQVAARTGNSWEMTPAGIAIFHRKTKTFSIDVIPGASGLTTRVSNISGTAQGGGEGGGNGGGGARAESGQTTTMDVEIKLVDAIAESVKTMLGPGDTSVVSIAGPTLTVTATPVVLERVASFINDINARVKRQVAFDLKVLSVDLSDSESYGIDWNLIYESLSSQFGVTTNSFSVPVEDVNSLGVSVLDPTSQFFGSELVINALSQQGDVSVVTSTTKITLSGQPVPVQVTTQRAYTARVETTLVPDAGTQTTTEPGTVTTGFASSILPVVTDSGEILVQMQVQLSALRALRDIGVANVGTGTSQRIQAPEVDSRDFLQRVKMRSGQTLVLSGFEQSRLKSDARGVGDADFFLAGGGANSEKARTVIVVLLTPQVMP